MPKWLHTRCVDPKPPLGMEQFAPTSFQESHSGDIRALCYLSMANTCHRSNFFVLTDYEKLVKKETERRPVPHAANRRPSLLLLG